MAAKKRKKSGQKFNIGRVPDFKPDPRRVRPKQKYQDPLVAHEEKAVGRLRKEINWERVERDLWRGATVKEVADSNGVSVPTLYQYQDFLNIHKAAYAKGNISLRRKLWQMMQNGNTSVAIFFAKARLGMTDEGPRGDVDSLNAPKQFDIKRLTDEQLDRYFEALRAGAVPDSDIIETSLMHDEQGQTSYAAMLPAAVVSNGKQK